MAKALMHARHLQFTRHQRLPSVSRHISLYRLCIAVHVESLSSVVLLSFHAVCSLCLLNLEKGSRIADRLDHATIS